MKWDEEKDSSKYQYYVVYYRKRGAEDDYQQTKSRFNSVDLPFENGELYEVAVLAANAVGHSPLVFLNVGDKEASTRSTHRWLYFLLALVILAIVAASQSLPLFGYAFVFLDLYVFGRRRQLPGPFGKLFGGGSIPTDASVAFENPAYGQSSRRGF